MPPQLTPEQIAAGWINLFDGETLYGWTPTSDANWQVKDGAITVSEGEQGFLMTNSEFADYELHVEFKAPASTNSGVFLRTPLHPQDPARDCLELNIAPRDNPFPTASFVARMKVELQDGGAIDDGPDAKPRFRNVKSSDLPNPWDGQWHSFDVLLNRSGYEVKLDGILPNNFLHEGYGQVAKNDVARGRIALQFREGPVAFRNIRLRPLGLKPMLNGRDLAGWNTANAEASKFELVPAQDSSGSLPLVGRDQTSTGDPKSPEPSAVARRAATREGVEAGTRSDHPSLTLPIEGRGPEDSDSGTYELHVTNGRGILETDASYGDFIMQLDARVDGDGLNSGVFFRSIPREYANGYESQIHNAYKDDDPTQPADFGTGGIYRRVPARRIVSRDHQWFTKTIVATGAHIAVWVNGHQVTDWTDPRPEHDNPRNGLRLKPGTISLQGHDPTTNLRFRNLRIAELPPNNDELPNDE